MEENTQFVYRFLVQRQRETNAAYRTRTHAVDEHLRRAFAFVLYNRHAQQRLQDEAIADEVGRQYLLLREVSATRNDEAHRRTGRAELERALDVHRFSSLNLDDESKNLLRETLRVLLLKLNFQ